MTTFDSTPRTIQHPTGKAPVVAFVATAIAGAALFLLIAGQTLATESLGRALPMLIAFGLAFVGVLPLFAAGMTAIWKRD